MSEDPTRIASRADMLAYNDLARGGIGVVEPSGECSDHRDGEDVNCPLCYPMPSERTEGKSGAA